MRTYRSRIDTLPLTAVIVALVVVDGAAIGVGAPILERQLLAHPGPWAPFLLFIIAASLPVLLALTVIPVLYRFSNRGLEIRSGLSLRWHIPISNIHRVVPVVSLRPAPALSAQRLRIDYQDGAEVRSLQISPTMPDLLLHDLVTLDAGLRIEQGTLVRHGGPVLLFDTLAS